MSLNLSQVPNSSQRSPPSTRTQLKDITEAKDDKVGLQILFCPLPSEFMGLYSPDSLEISHKVIIFLVVQAFYYQPVSPFNYLSISLSWVLQRTPQTYVVWVMEALIKRRWTTAQKRVLVRRIFPAASYNSIKLVHIDNEYSDIFVCLSDISETLEMRENLHRQLQEIMSATKMTNGRRTSVRLTRMGSGGADSRPNTPEGSRVGRTGSRRTLEALR